MNAPQSAAPAAQASGCFPKALIGGFFGLAGLLGINEILDDDDGGLSRLQPRTSAVAGSEPTPSQVESAPPVESAAQDLGILGVWVITEDRTVFSPGTPDALDPLGCAARRVPSEMIVTRPGPGRIDLEYADEPGAQPRSHPGELRPDLTFQADYPDASGINVEGRFVIDNGVTRLLDGRIYSGGCTFGFTGDRR